MYSLKMTCSVATIALSFAASPAIAHEFWLDPVTYTPAAGTTVPIVFRIGSDFLGGTFPYIRQLDQHFTVTDSRGTRKPTTLDGDDPATEVNFDVKGLTVIAHQRGPEDVAHKAFTTFEETLREEGLEKAHAEHLATGKPMTDIRERYTRYAKALVQVGGASGGADRVIGLPYELVALTNPYDHPKDQPLKVRVQKGGHPVVDALVKCFHRATPESKPSQKNGRTDAQGSASCDVSAAGEHMISSVVMTGPDPAEALSGVHWVSHWVTLTFARK